MAESATDGEGDMPTHSGFGELHDRLAEIKGLGKTIQSCRVRLDLLRSQLESHEVIDRRWLATQIGEVADILKNVYDI